MRNHLAAQITYVELPGHRQVLPAGGVAGAQVLLSHHPLRRPRTLAGEAYAPQPLGFDLVHHCHQRIRLSRRRDKQVGLLLPVGKLVQHHHFFGDAG